MNYVMETIDEQIIKPILKRTASYSNQHGFLGELKPMSSRPPVVPKKSVCIQEDQNHVGFTYSPWEYDRSMLELSVGTLQLIKVQNACKQAVAQTRPVNHSNDMLLQDIDKDMDMVLTEQSFSRGQWELIGSAKAGSPNDFKVGEWADMFLAMGNAM